ncbi:MAG: HlyD family efflux transporter periplasmic adaptor subunit [Patescibacteria group bacterium]|nr:HlyD family efflux transporter periplasmic adaptor subunit [Patescibacteria group bacterium]MDE2438150.1 HlyD family efflux transporter periplasmic adaptor subunit [Patescibacteria group bacterium]
MYHALSVYIATHKKLSILVLILLVGAGYWGWNALYPTNTETRYVFAATQKGTIVSSISGSGQVSASNQVNLQPEASGEILYLNAVPGHYVKAGSLIARLDTTTAEKSVRDAEANLESAKLSFQKFEEPTDPLTIIQAQNSLAQSQETLQKTYDGGFSDVSDTFLQLPTIMSGLQDIIYGTEVSRNQDNTSAYGDLVKDYDPNVSKYQNDVLTKFQTAQNEYNQTFNDYKTTTRFSDATTTEHIINETYATTKSVSDTVKSTNDLLGFVKETLSTYQRTPPSLLITQQNTLATYISETDSQLSNLSSDISTLANTKRSIEEEQLNLTKLQQGPDPLDLAAQQLSIQQKENALADAQSTLADYSVYAPFDGVLATVNAQKYDSASPSTVIATLITQQKIAELSLNEIDAAKVKVGQKATLTFDAVDGLSIAGTVAEIDTIGTVNQGVVTYNVKIGFDTQDARVKPGMSVNAAIITDVHQDTLLVPNSAVKTQGTTHYVETIDKTLLGNVSNIENPQGIATTLIPQRRTVEVGISDNNSTEILSGLEQDDEIIVKTITATKSTTAASAPSLIGGGGARGVTGGGGGGATFRGRIGG